VINPRITIEAFDRHLAGLGLRFEATVIGGSALMLMGVTSRLTRDVDVLVPVLPEVIALAAHDFAKRQRLVGNDVTDDWLNNGPMQLADVLPHGWQLRVERLFAGESLILHTLCRQDLLCSKLFALADRDRDLEDCLALRQSAEEISSCLPWLEQQDGNELWPDHVRETLTNLGRKLGHVT